MKASEVRKKYIDFFKRPPRNHKEIASAPLVLQEDPTTLFTSSGMQPLVPYLMGEKHPAGKRLVNSQPSIRLQDIEEVGDNRHTTFFEMLGNWSLGDYFKKEQLPWFWEFLTRELKLDPSRLYATVYRGEAKLNVDRDEESVEIWKEIFSKEGIDAKAVDRAEEKGMQGGRIFYYSGNWWSRSGQPEDMPPGEIGGPDSEVFFKFEDVEHDESYGKFCHPECECGRFLEIGNSVFIQYKKLKDGSMESLPQKNVDFGGGYERLVAAVNDSSDIFNTDLFEKSIRSIEKASGKAFKGKDKEAFRIIADHVRAAVFLIDSQVTPSNKEHGYILRRLIRRSVVKMRELKDKVEAGDFQDPVEAVYETYKDIYLDYSAKDKTAGVVAGEVEKFKNTLERGMREVERIDRINAKKAFDLYQSYGFPIEITRELFARKGQEIDRVKFEKEFEKHKEKSRSASAGKFKGGLADSKEETTRLHSATHLLHESLRRVLGEHVKQKGSNVTSKRLRFDFSHDEKLTEKQLQKVEDMINDQIEKDLPVSSETMTFKEAVDSGALAFFGERYGKKVKVYTIGDPAITYFSREVCGGPHVSSTAKIGRVKINKQKKIGSGLIRVYAVLKDG